MIGSTRGKEEALDRLPAQDFDVIYNVVTFIASRAVGREDRWDLVLMKRRTEKEEAHRSESQQAQEGLR